MRGGGGTLLLTAALLSLSLIEQSQAQLYLHIYPSQDNPTNQTVWIFSGSSTAASGNTIRVSSSSISSFNAGDSFNLHLSQNDGNIFDANKPSVQGENVSLSSLFSSSNAKDIASVNARIPGGGKTNITFAASTTNTPTITIASGSRTISHLYMKDDGILDDLGIRTSSSLSYSVGQSSAWVGAGIINKPIGDFFGGRTFNNLGAGSNPNWGPWFAAASDGSVRVVVNSQVIPEPEEYAFVFALFALAFVLFHRRRMMQKKRRQQTATS